MMALPNMIVSPMVLGLLGEMCRAHQYAIHFSNIFYIANIIPQIRLFAEYFFLFQFLLLYDWSVRN